MRLPGALFKTLVSATLVIAVSCDGSKEPTVKGPEPTTYDVRGVVRQVRDLGDGHTQLSVHHEAIPDFVSINGEVIGMKSMTMPFTVADQVDLSGVDAGAKIQFDLSVDWSRPEPALIDSLEVLPEDTDLEVGSGR